MTDTRPDRATAEGEIDYEAFGEIISQAIGSKEYPTYPAVARAVVAALRDQGLVVAPRDSLEFMVREAESASDLRPRSDPFNVHTRALRATIAVPCNHTWYWLSDDTEACSKCGADKPALAAPGDGGVGG
jgi:hypothetical protein